MGWGNKARARTAAIGVALAWALMLGACATSSQPTAPFETYLRFDISALGAHPTGVAAAPDGTVWFSELGGNEAIGRLNGTVEFPLPVPKSQLEITTGPDDALWFIEADNVIGRITPTGMVAEYPFDVPYSSPQDIASGPDGALWFTEANNRTVASEAKYQDAIIRLSTAGMFTSFPLPALVGPDGIIAGPDGALWFTEMRADAIGRMTTDGALSQYPLPHAGSGPHRITIGPDGALWFTERSGNRIGRITLAGTITEYHIPEGGRPWGLVAGPDGALWFTQGAGPELGRLSVKGAFTSLKPFVNGSYSAGDINPAQVDPRGIVRAPSGALWFTEAGLYQIVCIGFRGRPCFTGTQPSPTPPLSATP